MADPEKPAGAVPGNPPPPYQGGGYQQQPATVVVTQPGPGVVIRGSRPPDYFIPSIFACFCFWPTGLAAIYYSMQANNAVSAGDMAMAQQHANRARTCMIISFVVGVIWVLLVIIVQIVAAASVASARSY